MPPIKVTRVDISNTNYISKSEFDKAYNTYQVIHIRGFNTTGDGKFIAKEIQSLFQSLDDKDKVSWCVENKSSSNGKEVVVPSDFLDGNNTDHTGYCSFIVQHSSSAIKDLGNRLPVVHLPIRDESTRKSEDFGCMKYGPCIWFFYGKNYNCNDVDLQQSSLLGRPEHTDSVSHDGTWHYQLSGTKIWRVRPTDELLNMVGTRGDTGKKRKLNHDKDAQLENKDAIEIECRQGDILLLNTRLWWHSTVIPMQDEPSISYARDVYFRCSTASDNDDESDDVNEMNNEQSMTNVDGTYAAQDIEAETILFTEHTMPDCELHRSKTDANCQVVELEDEETGDSYMAVVSLKDIKAGEFFCLVETDEENEDGSESEGDWEEENGVCRQCPT